jgi:hypothetical protein
MKITYLFIEGKVFIKVNIRNFVNQKRSLFMGIAILFPGIVNFIVQIVLIGEIFSLVVKSTKYLL